MRLRWLGFQRLLRARLRIKGRTNIFSELKEVSKCRNVLTCSLSMEDGKLLLTSLVIYFLRLRVCECLFLMFVLFVRSFSHVHYNEFLSHTLYIVTE